MSKVDHQLIWGLGVWGSVRFSLQALAELQELSGLTPQLHFWSPHLRRPLRSSYLCVLSIPPVQMQNESWSCLCCFSPSPLESSPSLRFAGCLVCLRQPVLSLLASLYIVLHSGLRFGFVSGLSLIVLHSILCWIFILFVYSFRIFFRTHLSENDIKYLSYQFSCLKES